jgi:asparagine synthetase B (glutamine-hydrolysing)
MLISCKGQKEKMRELLEQIRGDYAFIFMEGDEIFVGKDYFGKRSLLLGMGGDYFIFTSVPVHDSVRIIQPENA